MKRFRLFTILSLILCMLSPIMVFADRSDTDAISQLEPNLATIGYICVEANELVKQDILEYSAEDGVLTFSNKLYSKLDYQGKEDFMLFTLSEIRNSDLGSMVKSKVYNFIESQDNPTAQAVKYLKQNASADFAKSKEIYNHVAGYISTFIGLICILVSVSIAISVLWDTAYLLLPTFAGVLERGEASKKPFGVSREAWASAREATTDSTYKNVLTIYFGKRAFILLVGMLALGLILSGRIYDIIVFFIDAFERAPFF